VADFVAYYVDNVAELATLAGYVPPSEGDLRANATALARFKRGPGETAGAREP
jgi:hypothetical protein